MAARRTWTNKLNEVRKNNFVGRQDEQRYFSDNFVKAEPDNLLYAVTGEGGVGKSTLLLQYEQLASSPSINAIVIRCDDSHTSPAAAMAFIAEHLRKEGFGHKEFDERLKTYRAARDEIENDPKAPRGALNMVVRGATDFAVKFARKTPGVSVFADYVDEKAAGEALSQGVNYVIDRWGNKDETRLVREPEQVLTPLFMKLLGDVCAKRKIVLMFDVFERTADALEPWLHALLTGGFGEVEVELNATFVIGGRDALDQRWTSLAGAICYVALEPFTFEETQDYLARQEITDAPLVQQIYDDTNGLPVLVELLASRKPQPGQPLPDISGDAVERFLSWIPDEGQRRAVLLAAVPRQFNRDVLSAAWGNDATSQFAWLASQSFVRTSTARGAFFHEKVRELMLRHLRQTTPDELAGTHARLCDYFASQQTKLGLTGKATYDSESWRGFEQGRVYHALSQQPEGQLDNAINAFALAFRWRWGFSESIVQVFEQVEHECHAQAIRQAADTLRKFYLAWDKDEHEQFVVLATNLLSREGIAELERASLYASRGLTYRQMGKFEDALADLSRAIELDDKYAWAIASRGVTYLQMGKFEDALADLSRAIELDDKYAWAIASRGVTYLQMGKFEDALADLSRAIDLDDTLAGAIANRGVTYLRMGKFEDALADFSRAIDLDDKSASAIANRGVTYLRMGKFEDALADLSRAIDLDDKLAGAIANRGETYLQMGKFEDALADFSRAIDLDDTLAGAIANRGVTYLRMGKFEDALADLSRAIDLDDKLAGAIANRGVTYLRMGKFEDALADFSRAIDLDDKSASAIANRGVTYLRMGKFEDALADLSRAIDLDDKSASAIANRGVTYLRMGKFEDALADLSRAIDLDDKLAGAIANRGEPYLQMGKFEDALADFSRAIDLDDKSASAIANRGVTYLRMGKFEDALADLSRAIDLDDKLAGAIANRGEPYLQMGKFEDALADLSRAIDLDDTLAGAFAFRGETYRQMGKFEDALADLSRAIDLDDQDDAAFSKRGETHRLAGSYQEALSDFNQALLLNSENDTVLARRGDTYRALGKLQEAIADLTAAIELDPESTDYPRSRRAAVYLKMGELEKAQEDIRIVKETASKNTHRLYNVAVVCILGNQFDDAIEFLRQVVAQDSLARVYARHDDLFDPIRDLPEFQELVNPK